MIWRFIKADTFFREYLPNIKSYKHKIRGKNGRGNIVEFTDGEKKQIKAALKTLFKHLEGSIGGFKFLLQRLNKNNCFQFCLFFILFNALSTTAIASIFN